MHQELQRLSPALVNRQGPILLYVDAPPHVSQMTLQKLNELDYETRPCPAYSPDLSPIECHFFKYLDSFLQEKVFSNEGAAQNAFEEFIDETDERSEPFHGNKEQYCEKYEQHFSYYCVGETDQSGRGNVVSRFCPSYKKACPNKSTTSSASLTSWPSNPFDKVLTTNHPARESVSESDESEEDEPSPREVYYSELKRRFPCKPDCDQLLFPHCTPECKCDYIYPIVQKFCNPPPIPLFLNTCRLWYAGCPKYEQYHYASQFVYSKAEKGKKVGKSYKPQLTFMLDIKLSIPVHSQPIQTLSTFRVLPLPLRPIAHSSSTLVVPPPIPHMQQKSDVEAISTEEKKNTKYARRSKFKRHFHGELDHHGKGHINKRRRYSDTDILTTQKTLSKKELYQSLKALNSLTSNPVSLLKDPASLITGQQTTNAQENERNVEGTNKKQPRAHQANTFPVIPSDAAFGANDNTFKAFDGLTDSSGRLHRPRSRSPFTKPGLWEANPDNPHNRDHANKFWYHPKSVSVDWLNGQIAWGAHWAVPAIGTGGTDGFSTVHFPTIGSFLNIPDDYD
uniref:C2H2-type domain-containing protein n=1 Tax=Heterorhabditis bacteriophora TaxID=37862 RepID=A0A1I7W9K5_HETBA